MYAGVLFRKSNEKRVVRGLTSGLSAASSGSLSCKQKSLPLVIKRILFGNTEAMKKKAFRHLP